MPLDENDLLDLQDQQDRQELLGGTGLGITPGLTQTAFQQTAPGVYSPTPTPAPAPTPAPPATGLPHAAAPRTGLPAYYNHFDASGGFTPYKDAPEYGFKPQAPPEDDDTRWMDYVEASWQGVLSIGKALTGVLDAGALQLEGPARLATALAGPTAATEKILNTTPAIRAFIDWTKEGITDRIANSINRMTPAAQKALTASVKSIYGSDKDEHGNHIPSPGEVGYARYLALNSLQMWPTIALAAIPQIGVRNLALWGMRSVLGMATKEAAAGAAGAAGKMVLTETAKRVAEWSGMAGGGVGFGALNFGDVFNKFQEELRHMSVEDMKTSPVYNEMVTTGGMTDLQARGEILKTVLPSLFVKAFGTGAAAGTGIASIVTGRTLGTAGRGLLGRMAIGAGEGGAVMGAQGGANALIEQQAQQQAGIRKDIDLAPIMAEAFSWGLPGMAFGVLGAGVGRQGGAIRKDIPPPTPVPPPGGHDGVDPAHSAALGAALGAARQGAARQGELPLIHPPPGGTPERPQREMFQPGEQGPAVKPGEAPPTPPPMRTEMPPATAPIAAPGERTPGYQAPQRPSPMLDPEGRPILTAEPGETVPPPPPARLTGEPPPEPPPPGPPQPTLPLTGGAGERPPAAQAAVQTSQAAAPNMVVPPLAQQAVKTSRGEAPAGPHPLDGMKHSDIVDAVVTLPNQPLSRKTLQGMSDDRLKKIYTQRSTASTATQPDSTVAKGGPPAPASETAATSGSAAETQAAPPVPGALTPPAPEGTRHPLKPTIEPTAKIPAGVRSEGGPAPETVPGSAQATAKEAPEITKLKGAEKEVTPGVTPGEDPRDDAMAHLAAARRVIPVKRGSDVEKLVNQAMAEMQTGITKSSGSDADLMSLIHKAIQPRDNDAPGMLAARRGVASSFHRQQFGKELKLPRIPTKAAEDARPEIEQVRAEEQQRGGAEATAKATVSDAIEEKAVGASATGETTGAETVHEPVPKGTSIPVKAKALVKQILDPQHEMDVPAAEKILAKTNNLGRPRTEGFGDLHDAMESEWKRLHGEAGQKTKARLEAELARLDRQIPMNKEGTEGYRLEEEMHDRAVAAVQAKLDDWAPERVLTLAKTMSEVADRVKAATEQGKAAADDARLAKQAQLRAKMTPKGEPPRNVEARLAGINPRSSRYVLDSINDKRIDAGFVDKFEHSGDNRPHYTTHEFLKDVIQDPLVNSELPPFRMMATQLLKLVDNVPMMTPEQAFREHRLSRERYEHYMNEKDGITVGAYEPEGHFILINPEQRRASGTYVNTGLHEVVHAIVHPYVERLINFDPNHPHLLALQAIRHELEQQYIAAAKNGDLSPKEIQRLQYAVSNLHELHTAIMTDPVVHAFTSSRIASPQLITRLARYGFAPKAGRSIWDNFMNWTRRLLGMAPPKSASEYTMFDHIMRPAGEITERAAKDYNRSKVLPADPMLRAAAEPVYNRVGEALRDAAEYGKRELPWLPSSMMDRTRPATVAITNMDQMVPRYKDTFEPSADLHMPAGNPLVRVRDAGEKIAYRTKQHFEDFTDRTNTLVTDAKSLPREVQEDIGRLTNEATIANVFLNDGKGLTKYQEDINARNPDAAAALQRRFDALSPEAQAIERRVVKIHADNDAEERTAKVEGALNRVFPENTEAQNTEWKNTTSTKARLEKFLANPDTSELAKSYGDAWEDKYADLSKLVAKTINDGWQEGDFVPLRRYGPYAVAYGEKGTPSEGLERFEIRGEAEERHAQLLRDKVPNLRNVDFTDESSLPNLMRDSGYTERLDRALNKRPDLAEHADDIRDLMNKLWLENMSRSDGSRMRRRGIQGASLDFTRVLSKEINDTAARVGYFAHGGERMKALTDMKLVVDDLAAHGEAGKSREARQVLTDIEKRVVGQESAGGAGAAIARRAGTFGYIQSLASLSHLITGTLENYSMAMPQIAARHGMPKTTLELGRVGKSLLGPMLSTGGSNFMKALGNKLKETDWNVADVMAKHLKEAGFHATHVDGVFNMLKRTGLIDHSYARELKRLANPEGLLSKTGRVVDYFNNLLGVWSHSVDAANRANVAMSSFNLEFRRTGGDFAKALQYAEERARDASPNYNLANKSRISTSAGMLGGMAGPITQFKQYGFHAYGILGNAVKASFARMPSEQRSEARYALAGMLATHALTAGSFTLIADPLRYIMGLYDWMTGATKPHDYQADLRNGLSHMIGPTAAQLVSRGAIDTFLGASVHRRIGFANMFEMPPLESFDMPGVLKMLGTGVAGASGEDAAKFAQGMQAFGQGDIRDGFKLMMPRPIRDAMTAHDLATKGVVTQAGRMILPANKITPYEVGIQALGFQPSKVSEAREGSFAVQQARDEAKEGHAKLIQRWLAKPDERGSIMAKIRAFNLDPDNASAKIKMSQLHDAEREQRKRSLEPGAYGLRLPRKGARELMEAGSFANVQ